ncbi:MAG: DUF2062 domain-containing protein [Deltaproteobacteria bacterium]|nr:DUF2062 domain-containing protein [Deltaproteobacteria bacterium]MBW2488528.1 DUF2062 domain-containing protein [Deltaproteobacteria bacterium]
MLIRSMLKEGMSLKKITLCITLGITLGIFPVLGMTTLLCTLAALAFRLNLPAIQLVNYMVYPVQLALLVPFYSAGSWLFDQQGLRISGENLLAMIQNDFWGSMTSLWNLTLYAIFTWTVICPILLVVLYLSLKPAVSAINSYRRQRK